MKIKGLIWLEEIVEKLAHKHAVSQDEVKNVLERRPYIRFVEKGYQPGEDVYAAMGNTSRGRYLIVFFVYKRTGEALVISARDMTRTERKRYEAR